MEPRAVSAGRGWAWIVEGYGLFRKSPALWLALLLLLFASTRVLHAIPVLGLVVAVLTPLFIVGLMEGCRALERGDRLELAHLLAGFRKNAPQLATIGGISLIGNLLLMFIVAHMGGEAITALMKTVANGATITPQIAQEMQAATRDLTRALLLGMAVTLPLFMALWYAPLLVYFNDASPLAAMKSSLIACVKNTGAMLVYGAVIVTGIMLVVPFTIALGQFDLALFLLAPIVVPSLYASYKDIFLAGTAPQTGTGPVVG